MGHPLDAPPTAPSWAAFLSMRTLPAHAPKPSQPQVHAALLLRRDEHAPLSGEGGGGASAALAPLRLVVGRVPDLVRGALPPQLAQPRRGRRRRASGPNPSPSPAAGPGAACGRACQSPGIARGRSCMLAISRSAPLSAPVRPTCRGQAHGYGLFHGMRTAAWRVCSRSCALSICRPAAAPTLVRLT